MKLSSTDIFKFNFCPYLYWNKKIPENLDFKFNLFENKVIEAIVLAEKHSVLRNSTLETRKILRKWDYIWWPAATKNKISMKDAEKLSVKASCLFNDYCKYDISDIFYPTVSADVTFAKSLNRDSILEDNVKIIKTKLQSKKKSLLLVDFGSKNLSARELSLDFRIQTKAFLFSDGKEDEIIFAYVYINPKTNKTKITSVTFRSEDLKRIEKNINYIEAGILNKISFMNKWNCKDCKQCNLFEL